MTVDALLLLRLLLPVVPAVAIAMLVDQLSTRRGLEPPPVSELARRVSVTALAVVLYLGVLSPLAWWGSGVAPDPANVAIPELFLLHLVVLALLAAWFLMRSEAGLGWRRLATSCGLRIEEPSKEFSIGMLAGIAAWLGAGVVMMAATAAAGRLQELEEAARQVPPLVAYMAGLPFMVRLALSLSAGFAEELFFRGFLQSRIGVTASTALFALAHLSYDEPLMLVGIVFLSLVFALLVKLRGNVLAAMVAHALFDAVQLLVVLPSQVTPAGGP